MHGFPNAFFVQPTQGANLISTVPHNLTEAGQTIAAVVRHALDAGAKQVGRSAGFQDAWIELLLTGMGMMLGSPTAPPATTTTRAS